MSERLYKCDIDTTTLVVEESVHDFKRWQLDEEDNRAAYNEDGWENIYSESIVSKKHARQQAIDYCDQMIDRFTTCAEKLRSIN